MKIKTLEIRKIEKGLIITFSVFLICFYSFAAIAQRESQRPIPGKQVPIMGWSSWNNFRVNINEDLIKEEADALITSGLKDAGYTFINVDDGFFGGRDADGNIIPHPKRFPNGMRAVADYIHAKGLKAGIYSDAGLNTCASIWDADTIGVGMGMYNSERKDIGQFLGDWDFDFLKVDWCGGQVMDLDEETRYTLIGSLIDDIKPEAIYNVCRWEFPGKWVINTADSWRISGDINNTFESILHIIDLNADLWKYAGPGHVNDMDMLQVGRGMSYEEDKAHFSMWCMMASPLLAGNDLRNMSKETIEILTNREMIKINQDPLVYQARRLQKEEDLEVWARPLGSTIGGEVAVALLNRSEEPTDIEFTMNLIGIDAEAPYSVLNIWDEEELNNETKEKRSYNVPAHGVVVLRISGTAVPFNIFQDK